MIEITKYLTYKELIDAMSRDPRGRKPAEQAKAYLERKKVFLESQKEYLERKKKAQKMGEEAVEPRRSTMVPTERVTIRIPRSFIDEIGCEIPEGTGHAPPRFDVSTNPSEGTLCLQLVGRSTKTAIRGAFKKGASKPTKLAEYPGLKDVEVLGEVDATLHRLSARFSNDLLPAKTQNEFLDLIDFNRTIIDKLLPLYAEAMREWREAQQTRRPAITQAQVEKKHDEIESQGTRPGRWKKNMKGGDKSVPQRK